MKVINENGSAPRRLYRSRHGKIAGVCQGLADYFNVDVTVVRLVALLAVLFGTLGFWAYIIGWIVMPLEPAGGGK